MLMICNTKLTKFSNRTTVKRSLLAVILVLQVSCDNFSQMERIKVSSFGTLNDGRDVQLFTLENARGTYVEIMNLGGIKTRRQINKKLFSPWWGSASNIPEIKTESFNEAWRDKYGDN